MQIGCIPLFDCFKFYDNLVSVGQSIFHVRFYFLRFEHDILQLLSEHIIQQFHCEGFIGFDLLIAVSGNHASFFQFSHLFKGDQKI